MTTKTEKEVLCIICETAKPRSGWLYLWRDKQGNSCESCSRDFHAIGYYLLDKAEEILEHAGIEVVQTKEKFGRMVIYTKQKKPMDELVVKSIQESFEKRYPEFTWSFS